MLLGYWTMRDAEDRDVPTVAAFGMKRQTDFYLSKTFEVSSLGRFLVNSWNHSLYLKQDVLESQRTVENHTAEKQAKE